MAFNYPPLDPSRREIRLLYPILREAETGASPLREVSREDDDIVVHPDLSLDFELRNASLNDKLNYTALSYVWGPPDPVKYITVNGKPFQVRANLACALRHFQYKDVAPAIWIDAICINQDDNDEKNHQIPHMAKIYSGARDVLIWLGPGREETYEFAQILRELHSIARTHLEMNRKHLWSYMNDMNLRAEILQTAYDAVATKLPFHSPRLRSARDFTAFSLCFVMTREWWYRIWVIQECAVASSAHFHLGVHKFDCEWMWVWTRAHNFTHIAMLNSEAPVDQPVITPESLECMIYCGTIRDLQYAYYRRAIQPTSITLVLQATYSRPHFNRACASDDRDRIYGLRGLAEDDFTYMGLKVDYNQGCDQLYIQLAKGLIAAGYLDILSYCYMEGEDADSGTRDTLALPSWTPDWTRPRDGPTSWFSKHGNWVYSASGDSRVICSFKAYEGAPGQPSPTSVTLRGRVVDEAHLLTPADFRSSDVAEYTWAFGLQRMVLTDFVRASRDLGYNTYSPSQLREAIWRIPIRDREGFPESNPRPASAHAESLYNAALPLYRHAEASIMTMFWRLYPYPLVTPIQRVWRWLHLGFYVALRAFRRIQFEIYAMGWWQTILHPVELLLALWDPDNESQALFHARVERTPIIKQYSALGKTRPSRPFLTSRGYIGLGPCSVERGDVVCILYGALVPHILRPRGEGLPGYVLVGDAFLYGGMDGELMTDGQEVIDLEIF